MTEEGCKAFALFANEWAISSIKVRRGCYLPHELEFLAKIRDATFNFLNEIELK